MFAFRLLLCAWIRYDWRRDTKEQEQECWDGTLENNYEMLLFERVVCGLLSLCRSVCVCVCVCFEQGFYGQFMSVLVYLRRLSLLLLLIKILAPSFSFFLSVSDDLYTSTQRWMSCVEMRFVPLVPYPIWMNNLVMLGFSRIFPHRPPTLVSSSHSISFSILCLSLPHGQFNSLLQCVPCRQCPSR